MENGRESWEDIAAERLLGDEEFNRIHHSREVYDSLDDEGKRRYWATSHWHFGERQKLHSVQGIVVGGKTAEEILALRQRRRASETDSP